MSERSDAELVLEARAGSAEAVRVLFRRHWAATWKAAYAVLGDRSLADDVAQEAFVRTLRALDRVDAERPLVAWLRRVAVNRAIDELRRRSALVLTDAELPDAPDSGPAPARNGDLVAAVLALPPARRAVVVLHYWLDYTAEEIAEALGIPVGTVGSRLSRSLTELRVALEASDG